MSITTATPQEQHQKLTEFLNTWPLERIQNITLQEYSQIGNYDTFSYWLEFGSEELGIISGRYANSSKFGIWNYNPSAEQNSERYLSDGTYKWNRNLGDTAEEAFLEILSRIIAVIELAQAGDFRKIEDIKLYSWVKWKIAFLYSNFQLVPVYTLATLKKIAGNLDYIPSASTDTWELHKYIADQKPPDSDFFDFIDFHYKLAKKGETRNYYIIGSKYKDDNGNDSLDVLPDMIEAGVVSTGFFWNYDFTEQVGKTPEEINEWIEKNIPRSHEEKYDAAKRTLVLFLNLKPGDIIAVKSKGGYNELTIVAYAQVKEVNGKIYDKNDDLGHTIYVDFLETGLWKETDLTYKMTIHRIIPGEREGHFEKIFGSYSYVDNAEDKEDDEEIIEDLTDDLNERNDSSYTRVVSSNQTVTRVHANIQNEFARYLKAKHPGYVKVERQRTDVSRETGTELFIYEIKPYNSAFYCIREGLGQLMDYSFSRNSPKKKQLAIVGVSEPSPADLDFLRYVQKLVGLELRYIHFDKTAKIAQEY